MNKTIIRHGFVLILLARDTHNFLDGNILLCKSKLTKAMDTWEESYCYPDFRTAVPVYISDSFVSGAVVKLGDLLPLTRKLI